MLKRKRITRQEGRYVEDWLRDNWNAMLAARTCTATEIASIINKQRPDWFVNKLGERHVRTCADTMGLRWPIGQTRMLNKGLKTGEILSRIEKLEASLESLRGTVSAMARELGITKES